MKASVVKVESPLQRGFVHTKRDFRTHETSLAANWGLGVSTGCWHRSSGFGAASARLPGALAPYAVPAASPRPLAVAAAWIRAGCTTIGFHRAFGSSGTVASHRRGRAPRCGSYGLERIGWSAARVMGPESMVRTSRCPGVISTARRFSGLRCILSLAFSVRASTGIGVQCASSAALL